MTDEITEHVEHAEEVASIITDLIHENRGEVEDINLAAILAAIVGDIIGTHQAHGDPMEPFHYIVTLNIARAQVAACQREQEQIRKEAN